jgi:hypothetical protein
MTTGAAAYHLMISNCHYSDNDLNSLLYTKEMAFLVTAKYGDLPLENRDATKHIKLCDKEAEDICRHLYPTMPISSIICQ